MFVLLSKTLDLLLSPLTWAVLCLLLALGWIRKPRRAALAVAGALASLCIPGSPAVANALMRWAEAGAVTTYDPKVTYDAVIVLGGGLDAVASTESGQYEFNAAAERLLEAYSLFRAGKARNLFLSGGLVFPVEGVPSEALLLARQLRAWEVPEERIFQETESRNTHENAALSAKIISVQGWRRLLLITSAAHMPRAAGCFAAQGLAVDTLPVDHRSTRKGEGGLLPRAGAINLTSDALRELFGRVVYRIQGYTP